MWCRRIMSSGGSCSSTQTPLADSFCGYIVADNIIMRYTDTHFGLLPIYTTQIGNLRFIMELELKLILEDTFP